MGKKEQLLRAVSGGSQNTGSSSGNSGSWQPSGGGQTKKEALFEAVTTQQPTRVENVYTPAEWAAIQAARNQQWRDEQLKDYQDMNALERAWDVVKNTVKGSGKGIMSNLAGAEAAIAGKGTILNDTYAMIRSVLDRNDGVSAGEAIRNWDQLGGARMAGVIPQAVNELSKEVRWGLNKLGANVAPTNETLVNWDQRNRDRIAAAEKNFYDKVGEVNNIYSAGQQKRQAEQQAFTEKTNARYAQSPVAQNVYKYGTMTGTQLPNIALSIAMAFTGNAAGAGATLAGGMAPATTQGLQFISAFNNSSKLRQLGMLAGNSVREIAASPQYWSSVSMETGSAYNEAIEAGVDPGQASAYAVSYGLLSGIIEVGGADEAAGGLEKMPKKVREAILNGDKAKAAWEYGKTIIHEIGEEEWQEMLSNAMRGGMLGEDVPVFSTENENAIINPKRMGQTALDTAITTALMGAGERAIVGGIQGVMDSRTYRGETDALLDTARQVAGEQDAARVEKIGKSSEKKGRMTIGQARQLYSVIDQNNATEQYRSAAEERRAQALGELTQGVVQDNLRETFSRSGIEATDDELAQIAGGYVQERNSVQEYAEAMRDAYQAGQSGNFSLQQAMANIESAKKVNPVQFRHAFQLGAGLGNTADTATTEGRNKVAANLAFLGTHADAVAELYEDGQNLPRFAMAMEKAVNLYAANGADLNEIYDSARRGKTRDVISMLTPAQIEKAAEIGAEIREEQIQGNQERAEKLQEIRREVEQIRQAEQLTPAQVNAKIRDTQEFILTTQQDIDGTLEGLKVARQAEPGIENTAEYQASMSRVTEMQEQIREAKEKLTELRKDRSRAQRKNLGKRKKGTVSYDGGTIEGTQVKGVDRSTMNRQQKIGAAMAEAVADAVDVDIILFDGEAGMGGAYIQGGTVYLNINSAIKSGEVRQSIIAASLSHELTHYMQQFAPEEYQQLRDFIIQEVLKVGPDELTKLVRNEQNWHKNKNLSYDEALDEVIANACQTMLFDSQAIRKLARQNMTLAQKVADVLDEICEKIRAAFAEIDTSSHELFRGVRDLEGQLDQVQALWDAGIEAASENRSAVREKNKNTATEGGEVQYQAAEREEILHLQDQIRENMWRFEGKPALATVNSEIAFNENNIGEAVSWIAEKIGAPVTIQRKGFGQVTFTKKRINQGFNYMPGKKGSKGRNAIGQALTTACVAAPEVVINGVQIGHHSDHKGTGIQTWTFAGPVEIDGERGIMAVVVRKTNQNYYKVHRILTPNGDIMVLDNNKAEVSGGGSPENRTLAQPKLSAENSIADVEEAVKGERQLQAWDEGTVYNNRALVSEDTLERWMKDYAASNPNYAQAYIAYMSPLDFLRMTTSGIPSRLMIEKQAEGLSVGRTVEYSKEQPIQLRIDTKTGKVEGHEGRHRMAALRGAGLTEVPVLLFDSSNKYDKQAMESLRLVGQDFNGRTNTDSLSVKDVQPLSRGNLDTVREKFATKSATQRMQEKYGGRQTVQFQSWDAAESEQEERQIQRVQYSVFEEDPETLAWLGKQEEDGDVVHTYKSFLEIDGKLYPPMASMKKGPDGKWKMTKAMEVGRWEKSVGDPSKIEVDPKNGRGYFTLKKDDGSTVKAAYNPYQHSSNLMINDQFTGAYSRPGLVTYECIIPKSELTSGYRAEYAKDAVGVHSWKAGPVAGKLVKAKGTERQVYLSRWLKPVRKVPDAEVAQHYKELLDGTDIAVPSNVVPPSLLHALEDAGVRIEYDPRAPKVERAQQYESGAVRKDAETLSKIQDTNGQPQFQVYAMEHDMPEYRRMLSQWGGMSASEIDDLMHTVDRAVEIVKGNLEALDYAWEADIDDRGFSPVKPNSDKLYKVSQDFSTLCRKRILQQIVQGQLQGALDRALTKEEGIAIRDALMAVQKEGKEIEVACALCYVESARMRSPEQIKRFLEDRETVIREFFAGQSGSVRERMNAAEEAEREAIYNEQGLIRGKGADDTMYDVRDRKTASLKRLPGAIATRIREAKKAAKRGYEPTAEQQELIDAAMRMKVTDFTTPEGLENLAKNYRDIFDAYTSYIRNATNSKGIENDTWWRAGDSRQISDLLIEQMNRENGLRTQSWSDFQVMHLMDYIAAVIELSTRNAKQHAYTKVIDYVDLMGNTGIMINMSLIPAREYTGSLAYDDVEGFVYKQAMRLRKKYHATAGTICIGIDNQQIQQLMASDEIDYIIPYHISGMSKHTRMMMHIPTWNDYQSFQTEKPLSGAEARENAARYGAKLLSEDDPNWHNGPNFSDWFDLKKAQRTAARVGKTGKYGVMTGGYAAMQEAAERYKQICAERGLAPKFSYGRGSFVEEENYWKVLIDRKMVDNVTGDVIEQQAIRPQFELGTIERILNDQIKRYGRVKADQDEATRRVVEAFLSGKVRGGMSSDEIAAAMQKPVDNVTVANIVENAQFQTYDDMHPRMQGRLAEADQLTEDIKAYFGSIPESLSAEDIEDMMDFDVFNQDAIGGDMLDPAAIVDELLETAKAGGEYRRRQAYRLAERLLGHMPALARQNYVGDGNSNRVQDRAFADWYNARHPSIYYPGYQPGDLFEHKFNKGGKADNIQREKDYLHGLLESGDLVEPELTQARELLDRLNNPQDGEVFYQQYDDTYQDTEAESNERALAYTRLQNENAMLIDIIDKMSAVVKGKDKTIEKILKKLARSRRSDAERLAKQLTKEHGSKADLEEVTAAIKEVGDYFVQTPTESLNPERAKELARKAAGLIAGNAEDVLEETRDQVYGTIRDTVKGRKLSIRPEYAGELDQYGGYTAFKKDVAGKFTLTRADRVKNADEFISVDQFYQDLNRTFGDAYFPEAGSDNGPVNEGEMVKIIADAFDAGEPITVNPFEAYMGEATEMIANTIAFRVLNDNVLKPLLPAEAEKAFDQLKAANGENAELRKELDKATTRGEVMKEELERLQKEGRLSKKELVELRDEVYELTNALKKADQEYSALQEQAEQRLEQVREEGRARVTEVRARERERAARQIDELKKHYQELQKKAKERREESAGTKKYREQVKRKAASLYEMLARNDDKHHVPEVLKRPVAEFLESLDFTSKRALRGGDETKADLKFGERLRELERMLSGQQSYIDGSSNVQADLGGYVDISEENMDYLRTCIEMVDQALKMGREFTINNMNAQQLKQLSNFISNLNTAIRNLNNFMANARFESIREAAGQDIEQMKKMGDVSERETGKATGFLMWENGTPYYVFKRFGKGGQSIFDGFARGWEKMAFRAQEIMKFTENLYTDKEVRDWKTKVHEFTLSDGSKMKITTAQIMELSMLLNREQALKHIEAGGIQIGDIQTKKGTKINTAQYHLTMEDILQITSTLDARQRKVAKALQGYMARKGAEWGNEISMRRFGYNFYTEGENYYPIKTVPTDRPMSDQDLPQNASMFRLLNLSSSKSLNPHANNALVVGNIFDTFADHMSDMAKLNGMGLPILDAIKYFNYKEKIPGEGKTFTTETMQATIKQAYGQKALSYFRKLMQDINGTTESGDRGDPGFGKLLSNYKIAAVGANLRVALLQPTSYVRATAVLKPQYLVGIVPSRAAYQEAIKYSGTAVWKSLGYYDTDIARGMRGQIQHDDTWKDKVAEASMKAAELGDQLTWSMLWTACKRQAKGENSNLRGQALMDRTADLFRETVYASQVMDSTLTRSEIMRGKTHFTKAASAFMAEPTLSYNILLDAYSQFRTDERKAGRGAAWQKNGGKIGKAFAVYVSSAAFAAIVESLVDAMRDDDDDEPVDKFLQAFLGEDALSSEAGMLQRLKSVWLNGNLGQDLTIIGKLPFVKDIMSILQGYGASNMATDGIESVMKAIDILKGNGSKRLTPWGKIYKYLQPISQLSGLAISNLSRDAVAIWNATAGMINPEMKLRKYDAIAFTDEMQAGYDEYVKPTGISKAQFQRILSAANTDGNTSVKQDEMGEYLVNALAANEITEEQAQALWKSQWNKESSKTFDKWRGKEEPKSTTSASTKTTSTVGSTAKKSSQPSGQIEGWDDFKTVAPIYGGPKREATYNAKPANMSLTEYTKMLQAADADGNKSLKQDELGFALKAAVQSGQMSWEAAVSVWAAQGWSHDLSWWAAKHP